MKTLSTVLVSQTSFLCQERIVRKLVGYVHIHSIDVATTILASSLTYPLLPPHSGISTLLSSSMKGSIVSSLTSASALPVDAGAAVVRIVRDEGFAGNIDHATWIRQEPFDFCG